MSTTTESEIRLQFYLTQSEIIEILKQEGYSDISIRTLGYWRSEGLLPELIYLHNGRYVYHRNTLDYIRILAENSTKKTSPLNLVTTITLENKTFLVHKLIITRQSNGLKLSCYTLDGILVLPITEEQLNAITR